MMLRDVTLYPYQEKAVQIMQQSNVMLAFDVGLGKTVTSLAAIEGLRADGHIEGPGIVVVPASLKYQWAREIHKFTDRTAMVVDGTPFKRLEQYQSEYDYLILSYDMYVRDWGLHKNVTSFLIADEASALRGWSTKRSKFFKKMRDNYPVRYALTATPIENGKAEEIFSIFEWLDPQVLGNVWKFRQKYLRTNSMGWVDGYRNLDEFHRNLKPYVIRRTHSDPEVRTVVPHMIHAPASVIRLDMDTNRIYDWIANEILVGLDDMVDRMQEIRVSAGRFNSDEGQIMSKVQVARMLLDHPAVVLAHVKSSEYAKEVVENFPAYFERSKLPSMKLDALLQYLDDFMDIDPSNKVVVFTSFVEMSKIIHSTRALDSVMFNGTMSAKDKNAAVEKFANDPGCRIFIATDAGGFGLDLPQANLVINYDLPWSAGALKQRNGRIQRVSSKWPHVTIQDLVVADSIEERMLQMLDHKNAVAGAILAGDGINTRGGVSSDLATLRSFLGGKLHREVWASA